MKKTILLSTALLLAVAAFAQDYKQVLQNTFTAFDTTRNQQTMVEQSNKLSLIAKKWPGQWETQYYAAYSKAQLSYNEPDEAKRDAYLDEAGTYRDEAVKLLGKENDETYVLAAMIANARLAVKPQSRWQKYGPIFEQNLDKAKELNPDNPRIYMLRGLSKFHMPKMFGGGKKAALPYFEKAESLYAKQTAHDISKPYWGKGMNNYFLSQAK